MTLAIWPLRLEFDAAGTMGGPQNNRVTFQTDSMIPIERPLTTARIELWRIVTAPLDRGEVQYFETWFDTDTAYGVHKFVMAHPRNDTLGLWKIRAGDMPYRVNNVTGTLFTISFEAMMLPGAVDAEAYVITADNRIEAV